MILKSSKKNKAEAFTVDRYNENIIRQIEMKNSRLLYLVLVSILTALVFRDGPVINSSMELLVNLTKISWVISVPYFIIQFVSSYKL
jgi:hypothetical protein